MVSGGGQADVAGGEAAGGGDHGIARGEVLAGATDVAAGGDGFVDLDVGAGGGGVFLEQDGIGALRDDAAGEQANCLAGPDGAVERMAGGGAADDFQRRVQGAVSGAECVAVHG